MKKAIFNAKVENDAMSLMTDGQAENAPVEKNSEGLLTGFRIVKFGPLSVTKGSKDGTIAMSGEFNADHADVIIANSKEKGAKIPVDCNHMLYALAKQANVDESEIAKVTGKDALAMGYGELDKRADGLWIKNLEWSPLGKEIVASKTFRYHSPVFRGLKDNKLRLTSVTLAQVPAIDHLDAIAAAETDPAAAAAATSAAAGGNTAQDAILAKIASILGLDPKAEANVIYSTLEGILKRMTEAGATQQQVDDLAAADETRKVEELKQQGLKTGQITNAMLKDEWGKTQTSISLAAYLKSAPIFIKQGASGAAKTAMEAVADDIALSEDEKEYCEKYGYDQKAYLAAKKGRK